MTTFHRLLGTLLVTLFAVIFLWGLALRLLRREQAPTPLWAVQHWTENLLAVQIVVGIVMLLLGRRLVGMPGIWLHYLYGSLFPLVAVVAGRLSALRRERYDYLGLAWGSFFAFALSLRSLQTGCGESLEQIRRCLIG